LDGIRGKTKKNFFGIKSGTAGVVALGILFSRVAGLIRERTFAHFFGNSDAGDAFKAALKIPNFLQNLFGEGVLSASFIPVYASLLAKENEEEAGKLAGTIASILALFVSLLVLIGVFSTPFLIDLIAPGFHGEKRLLTIRLVQIFFPGTGMLVMSAWCLGILNSHRRFFLSYAAPVLWNAAIISSLLIYGNKLFQDKLAIAAAWGLVVGSLLQVLVQLPTALTLVKKIKFGFSLNLTF
jgi:putative peptidoglycan lipid II flippase